MKKFLLICASVAGAIFSNSNSLAATHTWTGAAPNGFWSTPSNWESSSPPFANESPLHLVFPATAVKRLSTNNIGNITIDSLTLDGAAFTIAGMGAGTNLNFNTSVGHLYWNLRVLSGSGHALQSSLNVSLNGTLESLIATNADIALRCQLRDSSAAGGLSKDGGGSMYLAPNTDNTFSGATTVLDGVLRLEGSHLSFGFTVPDVTVPGPLTIGSASSIQHPNVLVWVSEQIADNAPVTVNQNGELNLADVDETIGSLTVSGGYVDSGNGTLKLNGNVLAQKPANGQPADVRGQLALGSFGRFFTVESNAFLDVGATISGGNFGNVPAGLTKNGPGRMDLSSPLNTFGGDLYVSAGTLAIRSGKQIGAATNTVTVATDATLALTGIGSGPVINAKKLNLQANARLQALLDSEWNGQVQLYGAALIDVRTNVVLTLGGVISGTGGFTKTGAGELDLIGFNSNTFGGMASVDDGSLSLGKVGLFTNAVAVSGPLIIGGTNMTKTPSVSLTANEEIASSVPVIVNQNAKLQLQDHEQTVGAFAVNGGVADSGVLGMFKLAGNVTSTNSLLKHGYIKGWLDLGNSPRSLYVADTSGWLHIDARVMGGASATLIKTGGSRMDLNGANTYEGLTEIVEGAIHISHPLSLGGTVNGTVVHENGSLFMSSSDVDLPVLHITNETLTLSGGGFNGSAYDGAVAAWGTNIWEGTVTLQSDVIVRLEKADDQLTFLRRVEGPGGLTKIQKGRLVLAGVGSSSLNNTYSGITRVEDGELSLAKDGVFYNTALAGSLSIEPAPGASPVVRVLGRSQFIGNNHVFVGAGGQLRMEAPTLNSVGDLSGAGVVNFAPGSRLVTGKSNQDSTFSGTLQGGGINDTNLSMQATTGTFTLTGVNNLAGKLEVTGGTLRINSAQPTARVDVKFQGTLGGTGNVNLITMLGGYLAPGAPLGKLHADTFASSGSPAMQFQLNGPALGTGYDQLEVNTAPDLSVTQLGAALGNNFNPTNGQQFLILRNNSALPIAKPFLAFPEGAQFFVDDNHRTKITYLGGDGNDVVLIVLPAAGQTKGLTVSGNRAYLDGSGTPGASYKVEATTDLSNPLGWVLLGSVVAGPDGLMQYVDSDILNYPQRFYRFVME